MYSQGTQSTNPVNILHKSIAGRYRHVSVASWERHWLRVAGCDEITRRPWKVHRSLLHASISILRLNPVSILHRSIAGRNRPVRLADGPIMARCRFIKNTSWEIIRLEEWELRSKSSSCYLMDSQFNQLYALLVSYSMAGLVQGDIKTQ